jgi:hypothetical protein
MRAGRTSTSVCSGQAGAFDIRVLIAIYGLVLTILGIIADPKEVDKAAGININLWGGIAMLVFAGVFIAWARRRPIVVPITEKPTDTEA